MKKLLTLLLTATLAVACCFGFTACGETADIKTVDIPEYDYMYSDVEVPSDYKVGFIFLHDEKSTYDLNFLEAAKEAKLALGLSDSQVIYKFNIEEGQACYDAAKDLVDQGCKAVFADSFGHESFMLKAAKDFPAVNFFHATGTTAHTENVSNFHNAFADIYQGRYLAGIAAGMKLNEMIKNKTKINGTVVTAENALIGYVGAYTYAEVISGYTSFYLGAKSVCPTVKMKVQFTGSWYDEVAEKAAAEALISKGCNLISQHADSMGAPSACEAKGVPNVSYNGSTISKCPNTFIISSRIDWSVYFKAMIASTAGNEEFEIPTDVSVPMQAGAVKLTALNASVMAEGTVEAIYQARNKMFNGELFVFDCANFTVNGEHLTSYKADVDTDANFEKDTDVIKTATVNGQTITYFAESEFRSAPYFDIQIDGVELLNSKF